MAHRSLLDNLGAAGISVSEGDAEQDSRSEAIVGAKLRTPSEGLKTELTGLLSAPLPDHPHLVCDSNRFWWRSVETVSGVRGAWLCAVCHPDPGDDSPTYAVPVREPARQRSAPADLPARPADPRPDLRDDSKLWTEILTEALRLYGNGPDSIYGILRGLRCCGALLTVQSWGLKLGPRLARKGYWRNDGEWQADKEKWLRPRVDELRRLLVGQEWAA